MHPVFPPSPPAPPSIVLVRALLRQSYAVQSLGDPSGTGPLPEAFTSAAAVLKLFNSASVPAIQPHDIQLSFPADLTASSTDFETAISEPPRNSFKSNDEESVRGGVRVAVTPVLLAGWQVLI